jgi:hypothetical protein
MLAFEQQKLQTVQQAARQPGVSGVDHAAAGCQWQVEGL